MELLWFDVTSLVYGMSAICHFVLCVSRNCVHMQGIEELQGRTSVLQFQVPHEACGLPRHKIRRSDAVSSSLQGIKSASECT